MSDVTIRLRPNGPLLVEGPIKIVDQNGNSFPINPDKPAIALCRCGASQNKPFCDGAHKTAGFVCERLAPTGEAT
jgi:CDGSH-type Zn-finger protein